MILIFSPMRHSDRLNLHRAGDMLTINGEAFDFSPLPDGATLPRDAVASDWLAGDVTRDGNGVLTVPLILPHGANAPEATRFPAPLDLTRDGPVELPLYDAPIEEAPE